MTRPRKTKRASVWVVENRWKGNRAWWVFRMFTARSDALRVMGFGRLDTSKEFRVSRYDRVDRAGK